MPHAIIYRLSDMLFVLFYYLAGYRRKVVFANLNSSFPEKNEKEVRKIARQFYQHLCDLMLESIRLFSLSKEEIVRRCKVLNPEVIDQFYDQGKDVIVVTGHFNNWEMAAVTIDMQFKHRCYGIYQPLSNEFLNKKFSLSRSKTGLVLVPKKETKAYFQKKRDERGAFFFAGDQSPTYSKRVYWTTFLNQETAVAFGTEKYAREYDLPVIFGIIEKRRRGFYEITLKVITETPNEHPHGWITETHTRMLEGYIKEKPHYWLWTHKRWKRKREKEELNEAV